MLLQLTRQQFHFIPYNFKNLCQGVDKNKQVCYNVNIINQAFIIEEIKQGI